MLRFVGFLFKPVDQKIEKIKTQANIRKCPFCKSDIPKDAVVCKHCRREIEPIQPEKEMKPQDYIIQREKRMEAINKVLDKFRSEYPALNFQYDTSMADIIIEVPKEPSLEGKFKNREEYEIWKSKKIKTHETKKKIKEINLKNIKMEIIEALRCFGIDAKARSLSVDRINTAGFFDRVLEDVCNFSIS